MQILAKGRNYIIYTPCNRIFYFNKRNNNNCGTIASIAWNGESPGRIGVRKAIPLYMVQVVIWRHEQDQRAIKTATSSGMDGTGFGGQKAHVGSEKGRRLACLKWGEHGICEYECSCQWGWVAHCVKRS
jgi:hypothetical protein